MAGFPAQPTRTVTDEEREAFDRDGAVLLRGVLDQRWVDALEVGLEAAYAEPDAMSVELAQSDAAIRIDQFPAARCDELDAFVRTSPVAVLVGQALDAPVRFYMDQMFYKPAGELMATAWHQDTPYYNIEGHDLIRAWVSCDETPRAASLEVVRGSHRWNVTYRPLGGGPSRDQPSPSGVMERKLSDDAAFSYGASERDLSLPPVPDIAGHRSSFDILGWDYEPGDVILFHGDILHGAGGEVRLDHPRRAHASMWAGPDVTFIRRPGQVIPDPVALEQAAPPSGTRLADLADIFPTAWSPS